MRARSECPKRPLRQVWLDTRSRKEADVSTKIKVKRRVVPRLRLLKWRRSIDPKRLHGVTVANRHKHGTGNSCALGVSHDYRTAAGPLSMCHPQGGNYPYINREPAPMIFGEFARTPVVGVVMRHLRVKERGSP